MLLLTPLRNGWEDFWQTLQTIQGYKKRLKFYATVAAASALMFSVFYVAAALPTTSNLPAMGAVSSKIVDRNGNLLYEIHGEVKRTPVALSEMSRQLIEATIITEDKDFYKHNGVSLPAIARAVWQNYQNHDITQGGSTITQQLVKNLLLSRERSYKRKMKEAALAVTIELRYSKEEILEMYLNTIPYGRNTYGVEAASLSYFNKHASDLNLAESAYLAALPKAPSLLNPFGPNAANLDARKDYILGLLKEQGQISPDEYVQAKTAKVAFQQGKTGIAAPHFVKWIEGQLTEEFGKEFMEEEGLIIETSLDLDLQKIAEQAVRDGTDNNRKYDGQNASLVAMDPKTGEVLAMVGSKNYFAAPYPTGCTPGVNCKFDPKVNTALTLRQPGSSFKPYTYATAFSSQFKFSPASKILDKAANFGRVGGIAYIPKNYDGKQHGIISMRKALAGSLNIPAVRTLQMVGVQNVIDNVRKMGITSPMENCGLSLTLGACEVSLTEHVAGFGVFATNGKKAPLTPLLKITDKRGNVLYQATNEPVQVLEEQASYLVTDILSDNKARSYIFGPRSKLILADRPVAAKTGTSQNFKDGWTIGFTPQIVAGVWVGNNNGSLMKGKADGSYVAAPIWNKFMTEAHKNLPVEEFEMPDGVQKIKISGRSGNLATNFTVDPVMETFADYAVPTKQDTYRPPPPPKPEELIAETPKPESVETVVAKDTQAIKESPIENKAAPIPGT